MALKLETPAPTRARRIPRQARSRARVRAILDAAERLLVEEGLEAVSARRIAEEARVSVPSFYQYFSDKEGVIEALSTRYVEEFTGLMEGFAERAGREQWDDLPGVIIDAYAALYRARPGHRALWLGPDQSAQVRAADELKKRAEVEGLSKVLVRQGLARDDAQLQTICLAMVLTGDALLGAAFRANPAGDPSLIEEAKRVLRGYLADCMGRYQGLRE